MRGGWLRRWIRLVGRVLFSGSAGAAVALLSVVVGAWFEAEIFCLVGMVLILRRVAISGLRAIQDAGSRQEWQLTIVVIAAFISFIVFAMGAPVVFQRYGWVVAALLFAQRLQHVRLGQPPAREARAAGGLAGSSDRSASGRP